MAAPIGGPDADESKSRNVHIPSIFDIRTSITQLSSSAAESMISKDIGSGDGKEHHGTIPLASSSATPPRRAYRAKMGDVAIEVINEREKRSRMRRNAESQGNVEVYNQIPQRKHMRNVLTRMEGELNHLNFHNTNKIIVIMKCVGTCVLLKGSTLMVTSPVARAYQNAIGPSEPS